MFDTIKRLILPDSNLHCPRCDKSLLEHDEAACVRRMSRRFLFQAAAGVVAATTSEIVAPNLLDTVDRLCSLSAIRKSNQFLTAEEIMRAMLDALRNNIIHLQMASKHYDAALGRAQMLSESQSDRDLIIGDQWPMGMKIGDTIQFRPPARYIQA